MSNLVKLVAVENLTTLAFSLVNMESPIDGRTLPAGQTLVFGAHDEGIDVPDLDAGNVGGHVLSISAPPSYGPFGYDVCTVNGEVHLVNPSTGATTAIPGASGAGGSIKLTFSMDGITCAPMAMPPLETPRLQGVQNLLPYALRLRNLETPTDDVALVAAGTWTAVPGRMGKGIDIPACDDEGRWDGHRIALASEDGTFTMNLYCIGYDIFYSFGAAYSTARVAVPGGRSQGDGPKCLVIKSEREVALVDTPADFDTGRWSNWPSPEGRGVVVHASVALMASYVASGSADVAAMNRYLTRVTICDQDNAPIPNAVVELSASASVSIEANGAAMTAPEIGFAPLRIEATAAGVVTLSHEAGTLAAPSFRLVVKAPGFPDHAVEIHPAEHVAEKLDAIKTDDDWRAQKRSSGAPLLAPGASVPEGTADAMRTLLSTALPSRSPSDAALGTSVTGSVRGYARLAAASFAKVDASHLPAGYRFAVDFRGASPKVLHGSAVDDHLAAMRANATLVKGAPSLVAAGAGAATGVEGDDESGFWPTVCGWFSDAWDAITSFVCTVVDGIVNVALTIAGTIYEFVVEVVSQVFQAVSWLVCKIFGIDMDTVVDWLGSVFDWDSIRRTHAVLRERVSGVAETFDQALTLIPTLFASFRASLNAEASGLDQALPDAHAQPATKALRDHHDATSSSPLVHWAGDALFARLDEVTISLPDLAADIGAALEHALVQVRDRILAFAKGIREDWDDLSFTELVGRVLTLTGNLFLDCAEAIFAVLATLAAPVRQVLGVLLAETRFEIPLLSPLFTKYVAPGKTTSLVDLCCLVVAIPTTLIGKLAGEDPFPAEASKALPPAGAIAGATPARGLAPSPTASDEYGLGIATATCQLFAAVAGVCMESSRMATAYAPSGPAKALLSARTRSCLIVKLLFDVCGYACAVGAGGLVAASGRLRTDRERLDLFLVAYQVVFRFKDVVRLLTFATSAFPCGMLESMLAIVSTPVAVADIVLQAKERYPADVSTAVTLQTRGTKGLQLLAMSLAQLMAGVREIAAEERRMAQASNNPELLVPAEAKEGAVILARTALQFAVPAAGFWRTAISTRRHFIAIP